MEAAMTNYIHSDEHALVTNDRTDARNAFDHERLAYVVEETVEGIPGFSIYSGAGGTSRSPRYPRCRFRNSPAI